MVEAVSAILRRLTVLLLVFAFPSAALAHRLDECLQSTLVAIEPGDLRLRMNLTPGAAVAEPLIALIDRDHDGSISKDEAEAYAESLKRDLTVRLDQRDVELKLVGCDAQSPGELRTGSGIIRVEYTGAPGPLDAGVHTMTIENRHLAPVSVYLINAAQPKSRAVRINRQARNDNQSNGEIQYTFEPYGGFSTLFWVGVPVAAVLLAIVAGIRSARTRSAAAA